MMSPKLLSLTALFICSPVSAASHWDGAWFLVPEKTRLADHSFTLLQVAGGLWRYDDGAIIYLFRTDRNDYPEPLDPSLVITATQVNSGTLDLTESRFGKPVQHLRKSLSADGSRLTSTRTSLSADGSEQTEVMIDIREGTGSGLEGTWRETAPPGRSNATSTHSTSRQPYWAITSGAAGEMTWRIPATGETLSGKLDGRARPAFGPQIPASESFYWEATSDRQIEFYYLVNGHLVERATERLSDDGTTWSDTLWIPAYPEQKDVRTFERR